MSQKNKSSKRTSVDLSEFAQKIKERYLYLGLKNILSAGLVLFDLQAEKDKFKAIGVASEAIDPDTLTVGGQRLKGIERAIAFVEKAKREASTHGLADDVLIYNELLGILVEPEIQEDDSEKTHGQISRVAHVMRKMSPDGSLDIEFLSEEDRQAVHELAKLTRPETKKPSKDQTA